MFEINFLCRTTINQNLFSSLIINLIMAGMYTRSTMDSCFEKGEDVQNSKIYDYNLSRDAVMRQNVVKAPMLSVGRQPDFYGPLIGNRVTKESFLQGRGHCLNNCPDCEVTYLPESVFPKHTVQSTCDRVDLDGLYTRLPKSCNGLAESDSYVFSQMPGAFEKGYTGYNAVVYTNLQDRDGPAQKLNQLPGCENYGSYGPTRDFSRYA